MNLTTSKLTKLIKSTRTYRFPIAEIDKQKFEYSQTIVMTYFNYGLQYLYQHYGIGHLQVYLPKSVTNKQYLIRSLIAYARKKAKMHGFDLKKLDYSVQSIDKLLMSLIDNFARYRTMQNHIKYWKPATTKLYLAKHNCNLSGYGRISYKHDASDIKSLRFKQQIHHNQDGSIKNQRITIIDNYTIKLPFLGIVHTKKSLACFKRRQICEVGVKKYSNGKFELQIVVPFQKRKHLAKTLLKQKVGLDVNLANDQFFCFSSGQIDTWSKDIKTKVKEMDSKCRHLQTQINSLTLTKDDKNNGNQSCKVKMLRHTLARYKAKLANVIDQWQLGMAKKYARQFPILAMEHLKPFSMRLSKRYKNKQMRKNTNHKLAVIHPAKFLKQMEITYENAGSLLLVVDPYNTSKQCSICNYIYHDLQVGQKEWTCPRCHCYHDRDHNATFVIIKDAFHPENHPILKAKPYLKVNDIIEIH